MLLLLLVPYPILSSQPFPAVLQMEELERDSSTVGQLVMKEDQTVTQTTILFRMHQRPFLLLLLIKQVFIHIIAILDVLF